MSDRGVPDAAGVMGEELAAALHAAVHWAVPGLDAVAAAVYLLTPSGELRAAMIGGSPPSVFTLPGRMSADAFYASARALARHGVAVLAEPDPLAAPEHGARPYPYTVASVPLEGEGRRFGSLTVLRTEDRGAYGDEDCLRLSRIGERLVLLLSDLLARGATIAPGSLPVLVPLFGTEPLTEPGTRARWGVPGVFGSAGLTLLYAAHRLAEMLNRATTMEDVTAAADFCLMAPLRANALALVSAVEGRLWVRGHSGDSAHLVRALHGSGTHSHTPAVRALRGRALFFSGMSDADAHDDGQGRAAAYLPLVGSRHVVDLPMSDAAPVVGVCCLAFDGPRSFPPEERAVLTMMAGLLGSAVKRIELGVRHEALATSMQKLLLPATLPQVPRLTVAARYRPADAAGEAGGDWYDVITMPDDRAALVIGDVEGHRMESAAVMGQLRAAVSAYATEGHGPAALLERTDRLLSHRLGTELLATCCVVVLDTVTGETEVALAGHPAPFARLPDGSLLHMRAPANVPLGVHGRHPYRSAEYVLPPGTVLALASDGLLDPEHDDVLARLDTTGRQPGTALEELADRLLDSAPRLRDDAVLLLAGYEGADDRTTHRTAHLHVQRRDLHGVAAARGFVHQRLCDWGLMGLSDDLVLITSELVTNALIHAGSDVDLRLRAFSDRVRLEVLDSDSDPPVPTAYSLTDEGRAKAEHGRGLYLVDALCRTWNTSACGLGKTVWLEMDIPGAEQRHGG
ncbi:ATP-binding SpoIIE family protein phosphatase [Streptomyces sp. NPDC046977]|uniref:ATP-binding SpoIIE family protein phosphatase n=1 Tax=Streptomyces sp. NPDC046977 TaxID=3154703 RepID=UPI003411B5F1